MKCRHCDYRLVSKNHTPRGLCKVCGARPDVRAAHPLPSKPPPPNPCRHCRTRNAAHRRRGLCWGCHRDPAVLALYPVAVRASVRPALCRGCGKRPPNRPRGLCWACYYTPGRRERFPAVGAFGAHAIRGHAERRLRGVGRLPESPTDHPPGSPEKVAVLEARFAARQSLWHPGDAKLPPPDLT